MQSTVQANAAQGSSYLGGKLVVSLDEADQFIVFRLFYIKRY